MDTNNLPEPICERCLDPVFNEPLYDNAVVGLCPKCFEDEMDKIDKEPVYPKFPYQYKGLTR